MMTKQQHQQHYQESSHGPQGYNDNNMIKNLSTIDKAATSSSSSSDHQQHPTSQNNIQNNYTVIECIGSKLSSFSDVINDNLIIARYGTFATVTLLTAYGLSQTPLFFRYRKVCEIPRDAFVNRYTIHGRIINVVENDIIQESALGSATINNTSWNNDKPIICLVRHSSPIERLFSRSTIEKFMKYNPSSQLMNHSKIEDAKDLLKVEIAGIKAPPNHNYSLPGLEESNEWLKRLALNRTPISCTLLSRRTIGSSLSSIPTKNRLKLLDADLEESAICNIKYRPNKSFFRQDLAISLVRNGRAVITSGIHIDISNMTTSDGSTKIGDIEKDVKYLDELSRNEFEAVKERKGIWSIESIRSERPDLVEEAEFEMNASFFRKLWRRITERYN